LFVNYLIICFTYSINSEALSHKVIPVLSREKKGKISGEREREKESGKIELEKSMTMATEEAKVVEESPSEKRSEETEGEVSVELSAPSGWKKV
jgi:hypothetical protein